MRVLLITPSFEPRRGGLETYVRVLAEELHSLGNDVTVLTDGTTSVHDRAAPYRVVRTTFPRKVAVDSSLVPWEQAFFGVLQDVDELLSYPFDVVHAHTQVAVLVAHLCGLPARSPLVASFHETEPLLGPLGSARTAFIVNQCPASLYVVGSRAFASQALEIGVPAERIRVIPMAIAPREHVDRRRARARLSLMSGVDIEGALIVLMARFTPRKGHARAIAALDNLVGSASFTLIFAGSPNSTDGNYLRQLQSDFADRSYLRWIVDAPDSLRDMVIDAADIGVMPSESEGLGLAALELMDAGVPVAVANIDGLRETVPDNSPLLVDTADSAQLASLIAHLIANESYRNEQGERVRTFVRRKFSAERAAKQTLDAYREVSE